MSSSGCSSSASISDSGSIHSRHSIERSHRNEHIVYALPTVPAIAHVREHHADYHDLSVHLPSTNAHFATDKAAPTIVVLAVTNTVNEKTTNKGVKRAMKQATGKRSGALSLDNVYISSFAGGKGRAKIGNSCGVPAGNCVLM